MLNYFTCILLAFMSFKALSKHKDISPFDKI